MQLFDFSAASPAANLALDEALLDAAEEEGGPPTLRFWESPTPFIALGYTNRAATETDEAACRAHGVPILRRASGGGTVLQGPGCLNYALIERIGGDGTFHVGATNEWVMSRVRGALDPLLGGEVLLQGTTDLTWRGRKFSGNAQKRRARCFLFHGTVLLDFNLAFVGQLLRPPSKEPAYRAGRPHAAFIGNVPLERAAVKAALALAFGADEAATDVPRARADALVAARYGRDEWNFRF